MSVYHKVSGYDKKTERLFVEHLVPVEKERDVLSLAQLTADDDGIGSYPLGPTEAVHIGLKIDKPLDSDIYDWFLEPVQTG